MKKWRRQLLEANLRNHQQSHLQALLPSPMPQGQGTMQETNAGGDCERTLGNPPHLQMATLHQHPTLLHLHFNKQTCACGAQTRHNLADSEVFENAYNKKNQEYGATPRLLPSTR